MTEQPSTDPFELPPADHNNPPEVITLRTGKTLDDHLTVTYAKQRERAREVVEAGKKFLVITNERQLEEATEYMVACRAAYKALEAARVAEKSSYDDAAGMVQAHFKADLDPLGLPYAGKGPFDPVKEREAGIGIGQCVTMAMTIYAKEKADKEKRAREAEAARLRAVEEEARIKREAEAKKAREEEQRRREEAAAAQRKAEEERRQLELAASRKRSEAAKAEAEAQAAAARQREEQARVAREEEERRLTREREQREAAQREEENRLAEQRAAAEQTAAVTTADISRVRGYRGGVASLKETYTFRDLDRETIDLNMLRPYLKDTALDQAVRAYIAANKATVETAVKTGQQPIKGVVFCIDTKMASRA